MNPEHAMHHEEALKEKIVDTEARERFWERERRELLERNRAFAGTFAERRAELARRRADRQCIVLTCMDERDTNVHEALGLIPGEAESYASGGGKLDAAGFERLYGDRIARAEREGRDVAIYLTPHECSDGGHLGCAAFKNDTEAQRDFFSGLKDAIIARHPKAKVHILAFDTSTTRLRRVDADVSDAALEPMLEKNEKADGRAKDAAHAGYGIYVGDAYRAWAPGRNTYFHLSAENPNLKSDADIAFAVMEHHSDVDLSTKPMVLHVDYPKYDDAGRTASAASNIDRQLAEIMGDPAVRERLAKNALRVVKTSTDMGTWKGEVIE